MLLCFEADGWALGRASGLQKIGPADATATPSSLAS